MRLEWGEVDGDYIQRANDDRGRIAAQISGAGWPRSAWIHPRWCGNPRGALIRDLHSWEEGRAAVERFIADYLAGRE